ncbi:MAG: response regulator [Candidatus Acidiferrales bacterium]|jgi:CheY-like chemotaxis protein
MSYPSEFSIFGKRPGKEAKKSEPEATPAAPAPVPLVSANDLPPAAEALAALFPPEQTGTSGQAGDHTAPSATPLDATSETFGLDYLSLEQLESYFPSENTEPKMEPKDSAVAPTHGIQAKSQEASAATAERRAKRRALISAPVRVRSIDRTHDALDDATMTLNVSRVGILLASKNPAYYRSMEVMVTFPYSKSPDALQAERPGRVVRISELPDGRRSVAVALGVTHRHDEDFISSSGEKLHAEPEMAQIKVDRDPNSLRPLVLALDAEASIRESLKSYLNGEGYDVITVTNAQEARDVLSQCTPSLLIAEIEGEGMPGYDICAYCKSTPRLRSVPVMLTTSSAYPSDYASAHSLGAVVCMAKPYRQDRLGHVVKLLAPPPNLTKAVEPPRPADPTRRHLGSSGKVEKPRASNVNRRFLFGRKS